MSTSPLYTETKPQPGPVLNAASSETSPERLERLEDEVTELRDTVARFADLMIGEVKDLRKSRTELPVSSNSPSVPASSSDAANARRPWLLTEMLHDFGTAFRMYFDPRYRMRRSTQIMVPVIVLAFAANCAFFNLVFTVPVLTAALEKIVDVLLAILLYKVLSKEIQRYRQVLAQLLALQDYQARRSGVVVAGEAPTTRQEMD
jgi:hypothetical protein